MSELAVDLRVVLDGLPDASVVVDQARNVVAASESAGIMIGVASADLAGRPVTAMFADPPLIDGLLRDASKRPVSPRALRLCHATPGVLIEVDCTACEIAAGGRPVYLLVFKPPQRPFVGPPPAESVARVVFENAPLGIFHADAEGVLTACNQAFTRVVGATEQQLVGLHLLSLANASIVARIRQALEGEVTQYIGEYTSVIGKKKAFVDAIFAPVNDAAGERVGLIGLIQDETERVNAERFVARTEKMGSLVALAAGTVHEIQNPLAFTMTSLDLAMRLVNDPTRDDRDEALRTALANAREGAARVATIARDLKKFARSDDEARTLVDLRDVVEEAVRYVRRQIEARAMLTLDVRGAPKVRANRQRLVQVFVNLLVNASEAIGDGPRSDNEVRLSLRSEHDGGARVVVDDSGAGIAPEIAGRLFEPFATAKSNGMGLGLSICHGIVTALGGEIHHEPRSPRGTRFVVTLPPSAHEEVRAPASLETPHAATRSRILVVDDEVRLAATIRLALVPSYDVEVCNSGGDAVALMRERDFDVVLCDVFLPDRSAPEIFDEVRRTAPHLARRFVFLTGGAFTEESRAFLQDVPNPRLEKPFDLEHLEAVIADQIKRETSARVSDP